MQAERAGHQVIYLPAGTPRALSVIVIGLLLFLLLNLAALLATLTIADVSFGLLLFGLMALPLFALPAADLGRSMTSPIFTAAATAMYPSWLTVEPCDLSAALAVLCGAGRSGGSSRPAWRSAGSSSSSSSSSAYSGLRAA